MGRVPHEQEVKVILKTQKKHFDAICTLIEKNASYETNEILSVSIDQGSKAYVEWVFDALKSN
ncbi:MAG: Divalent-cation tolerance protein CutA [Chlamydiae bacterium]|nr:Divalent-cation tolerance protein CutA [Chlamydiota bacterium]